MAALTTCGGLGRPGVTTRSRIRARNSRRATGAAAGGAGEPRDRRVRCPAAGTAPRHTGSTSDSNEPHPAMSSVGSTGDRTGGTCPRATPQGPHGSAGTRTPLHPSIPGSTGRTGTPVPMPRLEPSGHFDMWRDYLGLAATVAVLIRDAPGDPLVPPGLLSACAGPAPCAGSAPRAWPAPRVGPAPCPRSAPRAGLGPCSFCQHNGEAPSMYESHSLRDTQGRLQCPVLRSYVCPQCGATQDQAHTRRFCPRTHRGYTSVYWRPRRARSAGKKQEKPGM